MRALQVGEHQPRGQGLGRAGHQKVADHHGRQRLVKPIGTVERSTVSSVEEVRLEAELHGSEQSGSGQRQVAGQNSGGQTAGRCRL